MDIHKATEAYEAWLGKRLALISADMELKHQRMAESPFPFLRATFYRWVQRWPEVCPELAAAPAVLSVGDLHIENFGTWRDAEGRLIWGINDFDEAYPMPYTNDLVRLADQRDPGDPGKPSVCRSPRCVRGDPGGLPRDARSRRPPVCAGPAARVAPGSGLRQPS